MNLVYETEGVLLAVTKKGREGFLGPCLCPDQEVHPGEPVEFISVKRRVDGKTGSDRINWDSGGCWSTRCRSQKVWSVDGLELMNRDCNKEK